MYPATRPEQPMPLTTTTFFRSSFEFIKARAKELTEVPIPQPGHQMLGSRSLRRNFSVGFSTMELTITVVLMPGLLSGRRPRSLPVCERSPPRE
jgi:hypothetical protein